MEAFGVLLSSLCLGLHPVEAATCPCRSGSFSLPRFPCHPAWFPPQKVCVFGSLSSQSLKTLPNGLRSLAFIPKGQEGTI